MENSAIEWTDSTWNPIRGCSRVSQGCVNCYAETVANRFKGPGQPYEGLIAKGGQWNGEIKLIDKMIDQPLRWRKPRMIFVNSMSDLFHENVDELWLDEIFAVMAKAKKHTFQILTKRPERMLQYMKGSWMNHADKPIQGYLDNVWLGVSVEDQETANERIPLLLQTPAAVRWLSCEPLLGPVDLTRLSPKDFAYDLHSLNPEHNEETFYESTLIDWVVVGGESGTCARPMHIEWVRSLRDQCAESSVPFFFKQWGEWEPGMPVTSGVKGRFAIHWPHGGFRYFDTSPRQFSRFGMDGSMTRVGKKRAGSMLDGKEIKEYPE